MKIVDIAVKKKSIASTARTARIARVGLRPTAVS